MHGMIFGQLKKFVELHHSTDVWRQLLKSIEKPGKAYFAVQLYPDEEAVGLVVALSQRTGQSVGEVLGEFGEFIAPALIQMYGGMLVPGWNTLDLLENTESRFHATVIKRHQAQPPKLECVRTAPHKLTILYSSHRKMCALAEGTVRGVAAHYGEKVSISHKVCMLLGHSRCEIEVTKLDVS